MVHIGQKIKEKLEYRGIFVSELARRISTSRENIYSIFRRKTIDTGLLQKIGEALDHDFFQYYSTSSTTDKFNEEEAPYYKRSELDILKEIEDIKKEIENLKKENQYLKEINGLLKDRGRS